MNHDTMNHKGMDHGDMNHNSCSMNMSFTWSYQDTCIIFEWWHIHSLLQFLISCIIIVSLSIYYEYLKYKFVKFANENNAIRSQRNERWNKALQYGIQVGFSFMLMLVFMTYNGWLMICIVVGATIGHFKWNDAMLQSSTEQRPLACH